VDFKNLKQIRKYVNQMKKGEMLVSAVTTPEFVPAMKKAAAIITDYGGLMSHTAILCREFKIPCIVKTQKASKILKDGDWVEVDIKKGVVRILKRN